MPTIKIENKSDDDIIITFGQEEKELSDGESVFFENQNKGVHSVRIHRRRIPKEIIPQSETPKGLEAARAQDEKPGSHIQLDSQIEFDVNSSKASLTVIQDINGDETLHEDVIFTGYRAELAGAKLVSKKDCFANSAIKKIYLFQQLKGAFLPVGLVGIIVLIIGILLTAINLSGNSIEIFSQQVTLLRSLLLLGGGTLATGYFCVNIYKIIKRAKSLTP